MPVDELSSVVRELGSDHEERAVQKLGLLAQHDWRAATALALHFEAKGPANKECFRKAADWYVRALALSDHPSVHLGLARMHYLGQVGRRDFRVAREHLLMAAPRENAEAALLLAELLFCGHGGPRDLVSAADLFEQAHKAGYPLGTLGLARIARSKNKHFRALWMLMKTMLRSIVLLVKNRHDPRLLGIGPVGGRLYLESLPRGVR